MRRQRHRRLKISFHVDAHTAAASLRAVPAAAFAAVKSATSDFQVRFVGESDGVGCELVSLSDDAGPRFEVAAMLAVSASDPLAYKRFLTRAHLAIVEALQREGVHIASGARQLLARADAPPPPPPQPPGATPPPRRV